MKNNQPKKVLFVCSDNYTRSVTAEFCLRNFLLKNNLSTIQSFSAGTQANSDTSKYYNVHFDRMKELDIDFSTFERKQFDRSFFDIYDLIVGMGQEHKDYFLSEYQQKIPNIFLIKFGEIITLERKIFPQAIKIAFKRLGAIVFDFQFSLSFIKFCLHKSLKNIKIKVVFI